MKLDWVDIQESATNMFNIWDDQPELKWVEEAWLKLESQKLTEYNNELEKYIVLIRLITLATLYHEFCEHAFDEPGNIDYDSWVHFLEKEDFALDPLRLGQLLGRNFMIQEEIEDYTQYGLTEKCIGTLVEAERNLVVTALINGFGDESLLFAHLWLSRQALGKNKDFSEDDADEDIFYEASCHETVDDVLGDVTIDKMRAFEWVMEGMSGATANSSNKNRHIPQDSLIESLIKAGESDQVEFKEGACFNPKPDKKGLTMMDKIARAVAAFMNSEGGRVLIGIDDDGNIVGVQREYKTANPQKCNKDGYYLYLQDTLKSKIDHGLIHLCFRVRIHEIQGKDICEINVSQANDFAYFKGRICVRQGNRNIELTGKQLVEHTRNAGTFLGK